MTASKYQLQALSRAIDVLELIEASDKPMSLTEIAGLLDEATPIVFRILYTLEMRGYVHRRKDDKRYLHTGRSTGSGSIRRAIDLLQAVSASSPRGANPSQLAHLSGLDEPIVEELLAPLEEKHFVEADPEHGQWRLSYSLLGLVRPLLTADNLASAVRPVMEKLHKETGETVSLFYRASGDRQVVAAVIPSRQPVRYVLDVGSSFPLYLGAGGKAALAAMPDDEVRDMLQQKTLEHMTRYSPQAEELLQELHEIRARGYALSTGERVEGASAVAAPIRDEAGQTRAVLGLMMPSFRAGLSRLHALGASLDSVLCSLHVPALDSAPSLTNGSDPIARSSSRQPMG